VTDELYQPKQRVPQRGHLVCGFAVLYGVVLGGLQVQTASAQTAAAQVTRVTAVSATGASGRHREPAPAVAGTTATATAAVPASSEVSATPAAAHKSVSKLAGRYFVDFRSRTAASYGHAFLWYGRLNSAGKVHEIEVAGLHPATDSPIPYIIGHIFPVPSETGKSYGDLDEQYLTASYRVYLSEADAKRVFAYIQHLQASSPVWIASVYNCTAFLADVAHYMGMKTPAAPTWMYPETFVNTLRELNNGRTEIVLTPQSDDLLSRLLR
jgi:hypothetical protein